jgi:hypothetical protein
MTTNKSNAQGKNKERKAKAAIARLKTAQASLPASAAALVMRRKDKRKPTVHQKFGPLAGRVPVINPRFAQNDIVNAQVRILEINCELNPANLMRVVNSWVQYYITLVGSTLISDVSQSDFSSLAQALYTDLVTNAMTGTKSAFEDQAMPQIYRDLYEALTPKSPPPRGQVQLKYVWDPATLTTPYATTDLFQIGAQTETEYLTTGLSVLGPFSPAASIGDCNAIAIKAFNAMISRGHRQWKGGPTPFLHDTSAFAVFFPISSSNVIVDFANCGGVSYHEVPIRSTWLAGLQLVLPDNTRWPLFERSLFAGPQSYMGHRLVNFFVGQEDALSQVKIQRVPLNDVVYQVFGVIGGAEQFALASSGNSTTQINASTLVADETAYYLYIMAAVATMALDESPVTLGYQDPYATYNPLPWGSQFIPRDPGDTGIFKLPQLTVENLRKLFATVTDNGRQGVTYLYNVWGIATPYIETFGNVPNGFPTTFDVTTSSDTATNEFMCYNNSGLDFMETQYFNFADLWFAMQPFTKFYDVTAERETGTQMLTNLLRMVAPPMSASRFAQSETRGEKRLTRMRDALYPEKETRKNRPKFKVPEINVGLSRSKSIERKSGKSTPTTSQFQQIPTFVFQVAVGNRRPMSPIAGKFFNCVLPIAYVNADPTDSSLTGALTSSIVRLDVYAFQQTSNILGTYISNVIAQGAQATNRAESGDTQIELLQIFKNRADAGMGGALGSLSKLLFGFAKKEKWRKIGDIVGDTLDTVANSIPKLAKYNKMV